AGCTLAETDLPVFEAAFRRVAQEGLYAATLSRQLLSDGPLDAQWFTPDTVQALDEAVWGPGFEPPVFSQEVEVLGQRLVGTRHLKLSLRLQGQVRDGIWFGHTEPLLSKVVMAY
ncbi:single-stranded-DNA-specific exonuclease RecJ, partial [Arthrospira platensis SPKY1]|nr:single-stranded-DNA-specific exonuclease RecJ [Arthrospira platensis SPKY1]